MLFKTKSDAADLVLASEISVKWFRCLTGSRLVMDSRRYELIFYFALFSIRDVDKERDRYWERCAREPDYENE